MTRYQRISLIIVVALKLITGVVGAGAQPMWSGHESDYFSVVRFLAENGRLPERSDYEGAERGADISQATQPPLFTYTALPIVVLIDDGAAVPPGLNPNIVCEGEDSTAYRYMLTTDYNLPPNGAPSAGYALRFMNLAFALGMMLIVYTIVREITPGSHFTALVAAALVGFEPRLFELGIFISGESLLLLISSANLLFAVRLVRRSTLHATDIAGLIITALMGPLTKTNGYALIIATGAVLAYLTLYHMVTHPRSRITRTLLISAGILLLGIGALSVFNYTQYGSVVGRYENMFSSAMNQLDDIRTDKLSATIRDTYYNYTGTFPIKRQKLIWLYVAGTLSGVVFFVGRMRWAIVHRDLKRFAADAVIMSYALAAVALVLLRGNLVSDITPDKAYAPVRYYISGLPAVAVMMALGWQALVPARLPHAVAARLGEQRAQFYTRWVAWNWPGALWALVWLAIVLSIVAKDVRAYSVFESISPSALEKLVAQQDVTPVLMSADSPASTPQLRAYDYTVDSDGLLRLTAYIQITETPTLNYAVRVGVRDPAGSSLTCEVLPYNGRYPATSWEADQIVVVPVDIPNCSPDGNGLLNGPLDVTWTWLPADADGDFIAQNAGTAQHLSIDADLPRAKSCLQNIGVFDDTFQVIQYTGPDTATAGSIYLPAVNWYVRNDITKPDLTRRYRITHNDSGQSYPCEGTPRLGDYPIKDWSRGETIYFDQCALYIPPDAPLGDYTVQVSLVDNRTDQFLPLTPGNENAETEGWLTIEVVTVQ